MTARKQAERLRYQRAAIGGESRPQGRACYIGVDIPQPAVRRQGLEITVAVQRKDAKLAGLIATAISCHRGMGN